MKNRNGFIIIGDATPLSTDVETLKIFKDSGINTFVLYPNERDHYDAIKRCGSAGLNLFIFGGSPLSSGNREFFPDAIGTFPNFIARYNKDGVDLNEYSFVTGLYMIDEPGADLFCIIDEIYVKWFNEHYAEKKIWHINLLPSYATAEQLSVGGDGKVAYKEYVDKYADDVLSKVKGIKTIGVDHYPLRKKDGKIFLSDDWLFDLAVIGSTAKRMGAIYSVCIQVFAIHGSTGF